MDPDRLAAHRQPVLEPEGGGRGGGGDKVERGEGEEELGRIRVQGCGYLAWRDASISHTAFGGKV